MARTRKANNTESVATAETAVATDVATDEVVRNEEKSDSTETEISEDVVAVTKKQTSSAKVPELTKEDEILVVSLIPNVSYKDKSTGDIYKWVEVGQTEVMTFETLQNMWRESKGYFKNMWLKPLDDRVIKKFGLKSTFDKYDFLMDGSNYTKDKAGEICSVIKNTPSALKLSLCNKVKSLVVSGELTDISVIRSIEKSLNIDLIDLIG